MLKDALCVHVAVNDAECNFTLSPEYPSSLFSLFSAGTHMFPNGTSRRGRRMSIDLPNLHVTPPKGTDANAFSPAYFPVLPTLAYLNGE